MRIVRMWRLTVVKRGFIDINFIQRRIMMLMNEGRVRASKILPLVILVAAIETARSVSMLNRWMAVPWSYITDSSVSREGKREIASFS